MNLRIDDITPHLDPEFAGLFGTFPKPAPGPVNAALARARLNDLAAMLRPQIAGAEEVAIEDRQIEGATGAPPVPVRIFRPRAAAAGTDARVLVWIHGGGFIAGHHENEDLVAVPWVRASGCTVVSVGYRMAPEHRAPAALDDCVAALRWAARPGGLAARAPRKLAVGGMSAGGCLAAGVALHARDHGGPALCFQMLLIPVIDNRHATGSMLAFNDPRVWHRNMSLQAWRLYAGDDFLGELPPTTAPARAQDLRGLPPTFLEIAGVDCLRDEAIEYGLRLSQAGVPTEMHVYPGAFHASTLIFPTAGVSRRAMADATAALIRAPE